MILRFGLPIWANEGFFLAGRGLFDSRSLSGSWFVRETCIRVGLLALPLPGAGVTFFAAAKKVTKESSFFLHRPKHKYEWPLRRKALAISLKQP